MLGDVERRESSPVPPYREAFIKASRLLSRKDYVKCEAFQIEGEGEEFESSMRLEQGYQIESECHRGRINGKILVGGKERIAFDLSQDYGLEGLVLYDPSLMIFTQTIRTGAKIGMGTSELAMNPVPPERRSNYAQMATPFVEWLESFFRTGEMRMPFEIRP